MKNKKQNDMTLLKQYFNDHFEKEKHTYLYSNIFVNSTEDKVMLNYLDTVNKQMNNYSTVLDDSNTWYIVFDNTGFPNNT